MMRYGKSGQRKLTYTVSYKHTAARFTYTNYKEARRAVTAVLGLTWASYGDVEHRYRKPLATQNQDWVARICAHDESGNPYPVHTGV